MGGEGCHSYGACCDLVTSSFVVHSVLNSIFSVFLAGSVIILLTRVHFLVKGTVVSMEKQSLLSSRLPFRDVSTHSLRINPFLLTFLTLTAFIMTLAVFNRFLPGAVTAYPSNVAISVLFSLQCSLDNFLLIYFSVPIYFPRGLSAIVGCAFMFLVYMGTCLWDLHDLGGLMKCQYCVSFIPARGIVFVYVAFAVVYVLMAFRACFWLYRDGFFFHFQRTGNMAKLCGIFLIISPLCCRSNVLRMDSAIPPSSYRTCRPPGLRWLGFITPVYVMVSMAALLMYFQVDVGFCMYLPPTLIYTLMYAYSAYSTILMEMQLEEMERNYHVLTREDNFADAIGTVMFPTESSSALHGSVTTSNSGTSSQSLLRDERADLPLSQVLYIRAHDISVVRRLDSGAFGEVFEAKWNGTPVAVKRVTSIMADSPSISSGRSEMLADLGREVAILSRARHPHVVLFLGLCMDQTGVPCIVTEWVQKGSLMSLLKNETVTWDWKRRWSVAIGIARGMDYLHRMGIIHRDLKSGNVLIDNGFQARICDFGISKLVTLTDTVTSRTGMLGTVQWTAPEVLRGEPATPQADVYGMGIILWELVTRRIPYQNAIPTEGPFLVKVAREVGYEGLRESIPKDIPHEWSRLIRDCWHQDPEKRPTCLDVVARLEMMQDDVCNCEVG